MDFKRPARKSSVFETFLKSSFEKQAAASSSEAIEMSQEPADPVEKVLDYLDLSGPTSALELIKELNIGSTQGLKTLQSMESYGLIEKEETEEGGVTFKRTP